MGKSSKKTSAFSRPKKSRGTTSAISSPASAALDSPAGGPVSTDLFGQAVSPARTSRSRGPAKASTGKGPACGTIGFGSSTLYDPRGSSLRTALGSELAALTGYVNNWKESPTPAGRSWWVLMTLERRIDANDAGSCAWPTPRSEDSEQTGGHRGEADTLTSAARAWPTPNSADAERGAESRETKKARGAGGINLREAVGSSRMTPNSRDWKDSGPTQGNRKSPNLGTQCHVVGQPDQDSRSTDGKRQDWQTPTAGIAEAGATSRSGDRSGELLLGGQVRQAEWTTPTVSGKTMGGGSNQRAAAAKRGVPTKGALNPAWVAQLMGYPDGWLDQIERTD